MFNTPRGKSDLAALTSMPVKMKSKADPTVLEKLLTFACYTVISVALLITCFGIATTAAGAKANSGVFPAQIAAQKQALAQKRLDEVRNTVFKEKAALVAKKKAKRKSYLDMVGVRRDALAEKISDRYSIIPEVARKIVSVAAHQAEKRELDVVLLAAIMATESSFNPYAYSSVGAVGLMQIYPRAHPKKIAATKSKGKFLYDIKNNINMGATVLSNYLGMSDGDRIEALQRYNGALGDPDHSYANKVMEYYRYFSKGLPDMPPPVIGYLASK